MVLQSPDRSARAASCLLGLVLLAGAVPGGADPAGAEERRRGAIVGGVLGRGSGDFDLAPAGAVRSSGWSSGGNVVRGRLGWALTPELVVTGEYGVWRRGGDDSGESGDGEVSSEPRDRYLGAGLLAINLYPRLGGFLLRAGLGYGRAAAEIVDADGVTRADAKGPVVVLGLGYEHFLAHDMSLTVGVDFGRIDAGSELSGNFAQYTAAFHLYFPRGFPTEWF